LGGASGKPPGEMNGRLHERMYILMELAVGLPRDELWRYAWSAFTSGFEKQAAIMHFRTQTKSRSMIRDVGNLVGTSTI